MSASLTVSAYVFLVVFTFLSALVLVSRGGRRRHCSRADGRAVARKHLALLRARRDSVAPHRAAIEYRLAPPPIPQNQFTYMQAADYLHNPRSPYPISPPRARQGDER